MKKVINYFILALLITGILSACGSDNEKKKEQQEQARQDSLAQVRKQQAQARRDSIRQARQDSMEAAQKEQQNQENNEPSINVTYNSDGTFAVMTESWRSEVKAKKRVQTWKKRGFNHAEYVTYGDEQLGDIWYRIRLGRVNTRAMAKNLQKKIDQQYKADSWVTSVK